MLIAYFESLHSTDLRCGDQTNVFAKAPANSEEETIYVQDAADGAPPPKERGKGG